MTTASPSRRFKNAIYEQFARVGKALASPHRIELLELLEGPLERLEIHRFPAHARVSFTSEIASPRPRRVRMRSPAASAAASRTVAPSPARVVTL